MNKFNNLGFYEDSINYILQVQEKDGSIPWEINSKLDPWDHIESAMALTVAGKIEQAKRAYKWMAISQEKVGGWFSEYRSGKPTNKRIETNFAAYLATGLWHYFLVTKDKKLLKELYPVFEKAIFFVISMQTNEGDILWALDEKGLPWDDSLLTGCSSIYKSLECAQAINHLLGKDNLDLQKVKLNLKEAITSKPERFDRSWESKKRYSMDWYYPILCGVIEKNNSIERIESRWRNFVVEGIGCKCVEEEPWVTVAESAELVITLIASGDYIKAEEIFSWLHRWKDTDNLYWTGYVYTDEAFWPIEKPTWTAAAMLLAADSLYKFTDAWELFLKDWSK